MRQIWIKSILKIRAVSSIIHIVKNQNTSRLTKREILRKCCSSTISRFFVCTEPVVGYNYGSKQSDRVKQAWKVLLPTGIVFALCGTAVFLLFPRQLLGLFSASEEMLAFGVPALRIISVTFLFAVITILCGYFASGLGNGVVNMIGGALRQLVVLVPCLWLLIRFFGVDYAWFAFWVSEVLACVYSLWAARKELKNKVEQQ